jgi:hypothetical protein
LRFRALYLWQVFGLDELMPDMFPTADQHKEQEFAEHPDYVFVRLPTQDLWLHCQNDDERDRRSLPVL